MMTSLNTSIRMLGLGAGFVLMLVATANAAGQSKTDGKNDTMPATPAQTKQLRDVPDSGGAHRTGDGTMQKGDMPATKAQTEQLKESSKLSDDGGAPDKQRDSEADTQ